MGQLDGALEPGQLEAAVLRPGLDVVFYVKANRAGLPICGEVAPEHDGICIIMRYDNRRHDCPCFFVDRMAVVQVPQLVTSITRRWCPDAWLDTEISI